MTKQYEEEERIILQLNEIYKQMSPKFERCTGISQSRLEVLHKLMEVDEINQTDLRRQVNIDSAAVTRHLKQLDEKGIVARRKNPEDNRVTFVKLTEEGRSKIQRYCQEKETFISQVFEGFSAQERSVLSDLLTRVQNNVHDIEHD
ncbi:MULTISPECIES: MarR family winged helix-turn-helix transcriptional regulator [Pontibacillus]|uniref:MarR family transcriptional regulator n=1 Tax=Pontibacillus chungwhensis TaxID=265426 RepID=A0ABY8V1A8_9BACI|nr:MULTISPECIES: MarR family transcriptional regulator [Pontibacillus]MCD5324484.1 MarR family transcriptional regulator [Pontibacillus sp. HN14]WIF99223.1 MarR family transcriptional regulator [Pontibacillus chungwhensis]